jgi:hypothetical protein
MVWMQFESLLLAKYFANVLTWVGFEILLVVKVPFPKIMQNDGTREQTSIISLDPE